MATQVCAAIHWEFALEKTGQSWDRIKSRKTPTHATPVLPPPPSPSSIFLPSCAASCFINHRFAKEILPLSLPRASGMSNPCDRQQQQGHPPALEPICLRQPWLPPRRWCQDQVKTQDQQGQLQATELSFNHVSPTNVRRNYMAKSLQAISNI